MSALRNKYLENTLKRSELDELRQEMDSVDDATLLQEMHQDWMEGDFAMDSVDDQMLSQSQASVRRRLFAPERKRNILRRVLRAAAMIAIPIYIIGSLVYIIDQNMVNTDDMVVATAAGDCANVMLPDGTQVMLDAESSLSYSPARFNSDERSVKLDGAGYFVVTKDPKHPFTITSDGLDVTVLGTTFNLSVRSGDPTASLALEEGSVKFTSTATHTSTTMYPGDLAVLNRADGTITLTHDSNIARYSSWTRGDMIFTNATLNEVIDRISRSYGIRMVVDDGFSKDVFTGTLPTNDLNETLEIIGTLYGAETTIRGNIVSIKHRKR